MYLWYLNLFDSKIRKQISDFRSIPIIIISFNQLRDLKRLVNYLQNNGYSKIVIIDNCSTYKPLLEYFKTLKNEIEIHRLPVNYGHRVFWEKNELFLKYHKVYHVVTDADIIPSPECPGDLVKTLREILDKSPKFNKVGLSLRLDNIPDTNIHKSKIIQWESKFWQNKTKKENYEGAIDTTFAIYRPSSFSFLRLPFFKAIRTKEPYMATHGGWIINSSKLTEEQKNYFLTANNSSSWRMNKEGDLISDFAVRNYNPV